VSFIELSAQYVISVFKRDRGIGGAETGGSLTLGTLVYSWVFNNKIR